MYFNLFTVSLFDSQIGLSLASNSPSSWLLNLLNTIAKSLLVSLLPDMTRCSSFTLYIFSPKHGIPFLQKLWVFGLLVCCCFSRKGYVFTPPQLPFLLFHQGISKEAKKCYKEETSNSSWSHLVMTGR